MAEQQGKEKYIKCSKCKCKYMNDDKHIKTDFGYNRLEERFKTCTKCRTKTNKMELIKEMIITTYPNCQIQDVTDIANRVKNWEKIQKLMLVLSLKDNTFVVCEVNHDLDGLSGLLLQNKTYSTNDTESIRFIILRKPHVCTLPSTFGTPKYDSSKFQRALNTLLRPYEENACCTICYDIVKLGDEKFMCPTCYNSVCEKCMVEYVVKLGNTGWCPSCRYHLVVPNLKQPDDNDPRAEYINFHAREEICRRLMLSKLNIQ